jgi:hypothetical protein
MEPAIPPATRCYGLVHPIGNWGNGTLTDYPFDMGDPQPLQTITALEGLSDEEHAAIQGGHRSHPLWNHGVKGGWSGISERHTTR